MERRKFGTIDGAILDLNGIKINLRKRAEGETIVSDSSQKRYGYDHLGLEVEDIDVAYFELQKKGLAFLGPPKKGKRGGAVFLKGPDNITIELFQPGSPSL